MTRIFRGMRPRRLTNFTYIGCQRYFLTICTFRRRFHFVTRGLVTDVHEQFLRTSAENAFAMTAYCYMPDHVHLLIEGIAESSDLRSFVSTAKQRSAHVATQWTTGRLWQPGYFERVLRDDDDTFNVARYVVQNPVRAGLVSSPLDYPFWGSTTLTREELIGSCIWSGQRRRGAP